ncbi:MAG: YcbK family protein [Deltaproteobacteria bacterium]|nr:YcbK family protein [Deltaproteobacteria bacterium]
MMRLRSLALALIVVTAAPAVAFAEPDSEESGEETPGPGGESTSDESSSGSGKSQASGANRRGSAKQNKQKRRRKKSVVGHAVPESQLRATPLPLPSGRVRLFGLASREEAELDIFNDDGSFDVAELREADHMLRCKRTATEKPIDPRLLVILSHVQDHFKKRIEIVSGYRNQRKETSYHFKGSATDIRIQGVPPKKIVQFASTLDTGGMGIGLYPRSKFVHIDVRPLPSYRWIDNARPSPNSADKRPPRGFKRKKLQS